VHETPVEDFESQFRLNVRPAYLVTAAALPHLIAAGGGAVVCISTRSAVKPFSGAAGYIASKVALLGLVDALAVEYRDDQVRVNAVLPSVIDTPRQPGRDTRRRPLQMGGSGADRRRDRLPLFGCRGRHVRRARSGLWAGLSPRPRRRSNSWTCAPPVPLHE
jgi:NAD(P)-dependent dehydrogenase (short-subunit alcohol dehydrogenase family)